MINVYVAIEKVTKEERVAIITKLIKEHVDFMQTTSSAKASGPAFHAGFFSSLNQIAMMMGCYDMVETICTARDESIKELYND